jgi:hypothetical protein
MANKKDTTPTSIEVVRLSKSSLRLCLLGETPLIMNRLSEKTKHELVAPKGRKTAGDKATSLKHNPIEEFRASPHVLTDESAPSYLAMPATAFKSAMRNAALRVPGTSKAEIGQLVYVVGEYVPVFGIPQVFMRPVRSADMNRTPDIRTRSVLREWAVQIDIEYITPNLTASTVANLMHAGGTVMGVGDWRPEKGSGSFGQFTTVDSSNKDFLRIVKSGARQAQINAMENPKSYDAETDELIGWFHEEMQRRGKTVA